VRGLDAAGIDLSNSYLRAADLRGRDFSKACLAGASLNGARISGVLFPVALAAEEITLAVSPTAHRCAIENTGLMGFAESILSPAQGLNPSYALKVSLCKGRFREIFIPARHDFDATLPRRTGACEALSH